jgi:predicted aminopeptidase
MRTKLWPGLLLLTVLVTPGCYLSHVTAGQARLLSARQPIEDLLADPSTPDELRAQLTLVQEARSYARDLGLEVGGQYTSYVPWPGDRIVTIVVTTRPGEIKPADFWFPIVGRLPYKGFFDRERAAAEAERLRGKGLDVCEVGVAAYSTLGWLDDPVTAPMLRQDDGSLVETILHELVHATVYLPGRADFNEGIASFVGQEASVRFYAISRGADAAQRERARVEDQQRLAGHLMDLRERVADLYAAEAPGSERDAERAGLERQAREAIAGDRFSRRDATLLADSLRLNDACLALAGTYSADLPRYAAKLAAEGGDLHAFVARLREIADAPDPREALLAP